ncbi:hypothetical protein SNE40_017040 [Patella caerulea]|uniref:Uncharacterized protein n=1 Tax=Patella caerulea TaxID=87958 RepID=A0AAN8PF06_PATCE
MTPLKFLIVNTLCLAVTDAAYYTRLFISESTPVQSGKTRVPFDTVIADYGNLYDDDTGKVIIPETEKSYYEVHVKVSEVKNARVDVMVKSNGVENQSGTCQFDAHNVCKISLRTSFNEGDEIIVNFKSDVDTTIEKDGTYIFVSTR